MNYTTTYDTHNLIRKLIEKQFKPKQAEAIVDLVIEARSEDLKLLATKQDIAALTQEMHKLELRMIIKLGALMLSGCWLLKFILEA